jgi:hypothetical protein
VVYLGYGHNGSHCVCIVHAWLSHTTLYCVLGVRHWHCGGLPWGLGVVVYRYMWLKDSLNGWSRIDAFKTPTCSCREIQFLVTNSNSNTSAVCCPSMCGRGGGGLVEDNSNLIFYSCRARGMRVHWIDTPTVYWRQGSTSRLRYVKQKWNNSHNKLLFSLAVSFAKWSILI